jgi:predicted Zn-dependent protease
VVAPLNDDRELFKQFTENESFRRWLNTVKLGDEAQAIQLLDQALAKDPKCASALVVASTIYGNRNDLRRALDYSKRAVEADPRDARGYANLAVALFKSGQPNQARQIVQRGLALLPNNPRLLQVQRQIEQAQ